MISLPDPSEINRRIASRGWGDTRETGAVRALGSIRNSVPGRLKEPAELIRSCGISGAFELLDNRTTRPQVVAFCRPIRHMLEGKHDWLVIAFPDTCLPVERLQLELSALQKSYSYSARRAQLDRTMYARRAGVLQPITRGFVSVVLLRHLTVPLF